MPLVRAISPDRRANIFIAISDLKSLIQTSIQKLKLAGEPSDFKVCLDADSSEGGTEIDCDDILCSLLEDCSLQKTRLAVMVLPVNDEWLPSCPSTPSTPTSQQLSATPATPVSSAEGFVGDTPRRASRGILGPSQQCTPLPMHSIVNVLQDAFKAMEDRSQRTALVGPVVNLLKIQQTSKSRVKDIIVNYLVSDRKDFTKEACKECVRSVFEYSGGKFKKVFAIVINDEISSNGFDTFVLSVYNGVNYAKGDVNKVKRGTKRKRMTSLDESEENPDNPEVPSDIKACDYGCVAYNPPLPAEENAESQERKRLSLLVDVNETVAKDLMKKCYPTHRESIVRSKQDTNLLKLVDSWPLLKRKEFLFQHASILLGKNVVSIFFKVVGDRSSDILGFMNSHWKQESWKCRPQDENHVTMMLKYLYDASEANEILRNENSTSSVLFVMLVGYFKENLELLLRVFNGNTDDDAIIQAVNATTPTVIVKGDSIFDQLAVTQVLLFNKVFVGVSNVLEGVLLAFLSYYIFGLKYPTDLHSTLEFIQRFFIALNPEKGSKRLMQKRAATVDFKVTNLSKKIMNFSSPWNI